LQVARRETYNFEFTRFERSLQRNSFFSSIINISTLLTMSPIAVSRSYSIATMGADGIGPEVVNAGVQVLKKLAQLDGSFQMQFKDYDWSSETYKKTGKYIPDGGLEQLKKHDAILFGAVGASGKTLVVKCPTLLSLILSVDVPDHISLWGLRLAICQPFQQYANVRPTKIFRGTLSPLRNAKHGDLDWVIIRENSEGEYAGQGGRSHRGQPWETATEVAIFTRHAVERIIRFAFETAQQRPRKFLTVVTKSNAQRNGMVLWDEVALEVSRGFPDVKWDKMLVDAMTCRMVLDPKSIDTVVATNLVSLASKPMQLYDTDAHTARRYSL
jgi:isocitrate/isopropylmalate dehydrogenase